jgi:Rps23 Pro-64 3,4-dihydroxylase Tpa1-like proline 4-hydroxylase
MNYIDKGLELREKYLAAAPYPNIVLDGVFEPETISKIATEITAIPDAKWLRDDHGHQMHKRWIADPNQMPPHTLEAVSFFYSKEMVKFLEDLTGIQELLIDPTLLGGGIHKTLRGGHLEVHADFNVHPKLNLHRRLNVLLYLNPTWEESWNGYLELWKRDMSSCVHKIAPIANRMVVFTITDNAFHGHPLPLKAEQRLSLALYYYTSDRPEHEKAPFHWASWQNRPK